MVGPLIAFAAGVGVSLLTGGVLDRLGENRFRRLPLFWLSLPVSIFLSFGPEGALAYGVVLVLISNVAMVAFALSNRHVPGLVLVGAGIFLNALVIAFNGGMPVSIGAAEKVASTQALGSFKHEPLTDETHLSFLADRFPIGFAGQVWSVGDLLMVAGVGWMGFALPRRRRDSRPVSSVTADTSGAPA